MPTSHLHLQDKAVLLALLIGQRIHTLSVFMLSCGAADRDRTSALESLMLCEEVAKSLLINQNTLACAAPVVGYCVTLRFLAEALIDKACRATDKRDWAGLWVRRHVRHSRRVWVRQDGHQPGAVQVLQLRRHHLCRLRRARYGKL